MAPWFRFAGLDRLCPGEAESAAVDDSISGRLVPCVVDSGYVKKKKKKSDHD
jgi:hypothetical protein